MRVRSFFFFYLSLNNRLLSIFGINFDFSMKCEMLSLSPGMQYRDFVKNFYINRSEIIAVLRALVCALLLANTREFFIF